MKRPAAQLAAAIVALATFTASSPSVLAQLPLAGWTSPQLLSEGEGWTQFSALVAAPDSTVHAFWQSDPTKLVEGIAGEPGADLLWHTAIREGQVEEPVDILTTMPDGEIERAIRAAVDNEGRLHVLSWPKPSCLRHNTALLSQADTAQGWEGPLDCIGDTASRFGLSRDQAGNLHVGYSRGSSQAIAYTKYSSTSRTWSVPTDIYQSLPDTTVYDVRIAVDGTGRLHVVWTQTEAPNYYPPTGIFYSRSTDGGATWDPPLEIAGRGHGEPEIVTVGSDEVHIIWNGSAAIIGRYHRYSMDGGETWSPTHAFEMGGGLMGPPAAAVDSSGTLHAILSNDEGLFYAAWGQDVGWSPLQLIWSAASAGDPAAVITDGNELHVIFRERTSRVWYLRRRLAAPPVADATLVSVPAAGTAIAAPTLLRTVFPAAIPQGTELPRRIERLVVNPSNGLDPILISIASAALVIIIVVLTLRVRRR